jgi:hypothetical protein
VQELVFDRGKTARPIHGTALVRPGMVLVALALPLTDVFWVEVAPFV